MHLVEILMELVGHWFLAKGYDDNNASVVGESPMDRQAKRIWRWVLVGILLLGFAIGWFFYLNGSAR